jgi:putative membrane protein
MFDLSATAYGWVKAFHIIGVMAWMAGMLYLPRLFVYHSDTPAGSERSETFKIMERRLLNAIMHPAMVFALTFGLWQLGNLDLDMWMEPWLHAKLSCVFLLLVFHGFCIKWQREFAQDRPRRAQRFFRVANEMPTVLMIAVVIFVVVQPF